ncbi:MAG: HNH endonuclease [Gammaproteobacteria bacterium]|nr:HNH endonuclease [Gammaproteobacteria bacterium]
MSTKTAPDKYWENDKARRAKKRRPMASRSFWDRFWDKVDQGPHATGCWVWTAATLPGSRNLPYGIIQDRGSAKRAHRVSYELAHGVDLTLGECVLHRCDNPRCVNPAHLFLGTKRDNAKDRDSKGRQAKGETSGMAKLSSKKAHAVRVLYSAGGWSQAELAELFSVHQCTISSVVRNETWRSVL